MCVCVCVCVCVVILFIINRIHLRFYICLFASTLCHYVISPGSIICSGLYLLRTTVDFVLGYTREYNIMVD